VSFCAFSLRRFIDEWDEGNMIASFIPNSNIFWLQTMIDLLQSIAFVQYKTF
jgi:hypothetical protein